MERLLPHGDVRDRLVHGSLYKLHVHGDNGWLDRIPAYATRVVQDEATKNYTAQFWAPEPFDWRGDAFDISKNGNLLIYEAHVGMAQEKEGVGTYREFTEKILPIIKKDGYNAVQHGHRRAPLLRVVRLSCVEFLRPRHRAAARPKKLKELWCAAPTSWGWSHHGPRTRPLREEPQRRHQRAWTARTTTIRCPERRATSPIGTRCSSTTARTRCSISCSNVKYWLDEFHFDGYRFDGVTR